LKGNQQWCLSHEENDANKGHWVPILDDNNNTNLKNRVTENMKNKLYKKGINFFCIVIVHDNELGSSMTPFKRMILKSVHIWVW